MCSNQLAVDDAARDSLNLRSEIIPISIHERDMCTQHTRTCSFLQPRAVPNLRYEVHTTGDTNNPDDRELENNRGER